jgi:DNA (cytosine-5)-methyltransferase 1
MQKVLDLFSGIGGFSLGLERTGYFETVAFCEIEEPARALLAHHWPGVPCLADVTTADFESLGSVDLVTAGFPCQDISSAGKRAGLAGANSSLFWHALRTLCVVGRPRALLENVAALLNRGAGEVFGALASFGYNAEWHCIPMSAVGAPHNRDRIWIVADPQRDEQSRPQPRRWALRRVGWQLEPVPWDRGWQAALAAFRGVDDGLPRSVDRTDGLRNTVGPAVVEQIGEVIVTADRSCKVR